MSGQPMLHAESLPPGLKIGRYELIRRLAVGGMAEIYLARATGIQGFEKLVVLKRILPEYTANADFVSMFLDEARLSATLQHPNIAQVYDIGQYNGSYFFTMEFIRGEDVRTILRTAVAHKKRVPLAHTLTIIVGAAAGLHSAHEKCDRDGEPLHIVHRDVSPSNVLVSYDGAVKLLDFGVAKAAQQSTETRSGTLKGKVAYMSPEQCLGKKLDRRSDVFALGILLYELTCCRRLFKGDSEFEIMTRIVKEDVVPPSQILKKYPDELERIVLRALSRDRDKRYSSAQEMQLDLEAFARRHRLAASSIQLGNYMRETFIERMREQEAAIKRRPETAEEDLDSDDDLSIDSEGSVVEWGSAAIEPVVVAESGPAFAETVLSSGIARHRAETEQPELIESEPSIVIEVEEAEEPVTAVSSTATPRSPTTQSGLSEIEVAKLRRTHWLSMAVAAVAAAVAVFAFTTQNTSNATPGQTQPPTTAEPTPAPALPTPALPTPAPALPTPALAPEQAPIKSVTDEAAYPAQELTATPELPAALAKPKPKAKAKPKPKVKRKSPARSRSRAKRPKQARKPKQKPKAIPTRDWSLDSPLPPPRHR